MRKYKEDLIKQYEWIPKALASKKAENIISIDVSDVSGFTDVFFITSSNSDTHMKALLDIVTEALEAHHVQYVVEGKNSSLWCLIDCGDVIIHIFSSEGRQFYDLERIWGDAPQVQFDEEGELVLAVNV